MEPGIPTSWPATMGWLMGAVGVLAIVYLVLATVNLGRKLFGSRPPYDQQLEMLDSSLRKDMALGDVRVEKQIEALRVDVNDQFDELSGARKEHQLVVERSFGRLSEKLDEQTEILRVAAERRTDATNEKITELKVVIGKIDERTKKL